MQLSRINSLDKFFVEFEKCTYFIYLVIYFFICYNFSQNCVRMALVGVAALLTVLLSLIGAILLLTCSNILGFIQSALGAYLPPATHFKSS